MTNILSHSIHTLPDLKGYRLLKCRNYVIFFSNVPERIILESRSIVNQLASNPALEHQFERSISINMEGGYYLIWPNHRAAIEEYEVPGDIISHMKKYLKSLNRSNLRVVLIASTNRSLTSTLSDHVKTETDEILDMPTKDGNELPLNDNGTTDDVPDNPVE